MSKSFWVIETARTTYWDGMGVNEEAHFTEKIGQATKFHDFDSAEVIRCWLLDKGNRLRVAEHSFIEKDEVPALKKRITYDASL